MMETGGSATGSKEQNPAYRVVTKVLHFLNVGCAMSDVGCGIKYWIYNYFITNLFVISDCI